MKIFPAQLWIGSTSGLIEQTQTFLQSLWCQKNGCNLCSACNAIKQQQHHAVLWINPTTGYTRELIEPILQIIRLERTEKEPFFFVLCQADFLTPSCANMLLKSIEEPPTGYHFLLLAQRVEWVLPTIRSRCVISYKQSITNQQSTHLALFRQFTTPTTPTDFLAALEQSKISERESLELLDALVLFYTNAYQQMISTGQTTQGDRTVYLLSLLQQALRTPPALGNSKLFWKNLFFQFFIP